MNKYQTALNNIVNNELSGCDCTDLQELIDKYSELEKILLSNINHTQLDIYEGYPTGNVYVGMTNEDFSKLLELLGVDND